MGRVIKFKPKPKKPKPGLDVTDLDQMTSYGADLIGCVYILRNGELALITAINPRDPQKFATDGRRWWAHNGKAQGWFASDYDIKQRVY